MLSYLLTDLSNFICEDDAIFDDFVLLSGGGDDFLLDDFIHFSGEGGILSFYFTISEELVSDLALF